MNSVVFATLMVELFIMYSPVCGHVLFITTARILTPEAGLSDRCGRSSAYLIILLLGFIVVRSDEVMIGSWL